MVLGGCRSFHVLVTTFRMLNTDRQPKGDVYQREMSTFKVLVDNT